MHFVTQSLKLPTVTSALFVFDGSESVKPAPTHREGSSIPPFEGGVKEFVSRF